MTGNLSSRVFRALALVQIFVAIGGTVSIYFFHSACRNSLARQRTLRSYRQRLDAISTQLEQPAGNLYAVDSDAHTRLTSAGRSAASLAAAPPPEFAVGVPQSGTAGRRQTDLDAVAGSATEIVREAASTESGNAAQQHLEQVRMRLFMAIQQLSDDDDALEAAELERFQTDIAESRWTELLGAILFLSVLAAAICAARMERAMRAQVATREAAEQELRRERHTLEKRVRERTAELQAEVQERRRAEEINRGRNRVLEMLARDEPTQKILDVLVETVISQRSTWGCVLHLAEGKALRLAAQSHLPQSLQQRLKYIGAETADAPETLAMVQNCVHVLPDVNQEHRPWTELLRANGAQSAWSAPFLIGAEPVGTMTIYTLLLYPPKDADVELLKMSCQMASLILERQRMNQELVHRAYHDALTGLGNRRLGKMGLDQAIQRSRCSGKGVAVLWIDLNKFKQINDRYGHPAGDFVLQEVAKRLLHRMRSCDTLARMGGDEFMLVMEGIESRSVAEQVSAELLKLLAEPIQMKDLPLSVTASIGISLYPEDGDSADALQQRADVAMYHAKFEGLGVWSFTAALGKGMSEADTLKGELALVEPIRAQVSIPRRT